MTIEDAAHAFFEKYHTSPWYGATGIGEDNDQDCLFIYLKKRTRELEQFNNMWMGFPIKIIYTGEIHPAI